MPDRSAKRTATGDRDYPRLAMWHPNWRRNSLEECARYNVVVGNFQEEMGGAYRGETFVEGLRRVNPNITILTYFTNSVIRHTDIWQDTREDNPYIKDWPDKWFMTEAGTTITNAIDEKQTRIQVDGWQMEGPVRGLQESPWDIFRIGFDVLCDGEIMTVTQMVEDTRTIVVKRGVNGTKEKQHVAGMRIAPLVRFWAGSYVMNLTFDCPMDKLHGAREMELWSEYSFRMSARESSPWFYYTGGDQDGFLFDLMADTISWMMWAPTVRSIDLNHDNVPDPFEELDEKWIKGIDHVTELFHEKFPGNEIIRNNSRGRRFKEYNGENFESFPSKGWADWDIDGRDGMTKYWHRYFFGSEKENIGGILEFAEQATPENYTLVSSCELETDMDFEGRPYLINPEDFDDYKPDYKKMRWGLTSALCSGTYYCFVYHTDGHGALGLFWFDEYDDAGNRRGYLGQPRGDMYRLQTPGNKRYAAYGREFEYGFVICNPLPDPVEVELPPGKWQRIAGTQDRLVNNGKVEEGSVTVAEYDGLILKRLVGTNPENEGIRLPPAGDR